ncbi:IucD [Klebsiella pneumoniae]|uniref:IucD n=1 Tax=Klebsiella pneumoniae TaxID=573 RepID=A0A2X3BYE8_KLEPN|nr:IucD [Klebsiella pneumoniae]
MSRIAMRDECNFKVRDDFTLEWNGPKENNIFAVKRQYANPWHRRTPAQPDGMEICTYS